MDKKSQSRHLLNEIKALFLERQIKKTDEYDEEIFSRFIEVFDNLADCSYEETRSIRSHFFDIIEFYYDELWLFLFILISRQINQAGILPIIEVDLRLNVEKDPNQSFDYLLSLLALHRSRGANRLSSDLLSPSEIAEDYRESVFSMISDLVQHDNDLFSWDESEFVGIIAALSVGRKISLLRDKADHFYGLLVVVVQKLHLSQRYQLIRDFCEEILYTSIIDEKTSWGYLTLFIGMNAHFNANWALIYANICLASIRKLDQIPDLLFKRFLIGLQRFYRNYLCFDYSESIYRHLLTDVPLSWNEIFDITNTHFHILLKKNDQALIIEMYEFLVVNRERLFQGGKSMALPLLNILHHIIYHFEGRCNKDLFSEYIQILEMIVGPEDAKRLKLTTYASDPAIKDLFKGMLHKIQNTRSADDLVTEVRDFIVIADKLIDYAYDNDDYEAYLLAMVVKSDYSWVFVEKLLDENYYLLKANPAIKSISSPQQSYQHYITTTVKLKEGDECIWLAESKGRIFTLSLWGKNFVIRHVKEWEKYKMDEWLDKGFDSLSFDETINRSGQIEQYLESDQLEDELRVKKELQFASLEKTESKSIIIVKDMDLSKFPHNLILDNNGNFISSYKPMVCVPSIEWFIESGQADVFLGRPYTTSLWIPTDSGDYALNLLWSRLSNAISGFNINIQTTIAPSASLNSDVNILISHGSRDISTSHNISPGEGTTLVGTDLLISRGSILILFICHSGSMTKALFRDKVMSLIRQYFQAGCQAIVAPLWSLHVSVPPIWLPAFINSIENNDTVAEAVHKANMEVYSINKNPGAWACLHLYGNPYIKIHSHN